MKLEQKQRQAEEATDAMRTVGSTRKVITASEAVATVTRQARWEEQRQRKLQQAREERDEHLAAMRRTKTSRSVKKKRHAVPGPPSGVRAHASSAASPAKAAVPAATEVENTQVVLKEPVSRSLALSSPQHSPGTSRENLEDTEQSPKRKEQHERGDTARQEHERHGKSSSPELRAAASVVATVASGLEAPEHPNYGPGTDTSSGTGPIQNDAQPRQGDVGCGDLTDEVANADRPAEVDEEGETLDDVPKNEDGAEGQQEVEAAVGPEEQGEQEGVGAELAEIAALSSAWLVTAAQLLHGQSPRSPSGSPLANNIEELLPEISLSSSKSRSKLQSDYQEGRTWVREVEAILEPHTA